MLFRSPVHLPPLRDRGQDIELLANAFIQRFGRRLGKRIDPLTPNQLSLLRAYDWPGNVRELQNVIERAIILASDSRLQLERAMTGANPPPQPPSTVPTVDHETPPVLTSPQWLELERNNLLRALEICHWKVAGEQGAARLLAVPPTTLSSRMTALGIIRPRP